MVLTPLEEMQRAMADGQVFDEESGNVRPKPTRRRPRPGPKPRSRGYQRVPVARSMSGFTVTADPSTDAQAEVTFPAARPGPKLRAGTPSSETLRFRCSEAEAQKIREACEKRGRELSDVARELLLAWARRKR